MLKRIAVFAALIMSYALTGVALSTGGSGPAQAVSAAIEAAE